jgi:hypothetical protein
VNRSTSASASSIPSTVSVTVAASPRRSCTATIVEPSQSQRWASTPAASTSSSVRVPKPISGHSRRRRISFSNQLRSEASSRRWPATLTCCGP